MKRCSKCKVEKDRKDFNSYRASRDELFSWCRNCKKNYREEHKDEVKEYNRKQYAHNREKLLSYRKIYFQTPKGKFNQYREGAKRRNIVWALTFEQFALFWQKPCHYCGDSISTIGLDRIDTTQGYNFENVVACCTVCNKMKHIYSAELFVNHCQKIAENRAVKKY